MNTLTDNNYLFGFADASPAALLLLDNQLRFVYATRRWHDTFGITAEAAQGKHYAEIFPEHPPRWLELLHDSLDKHMEHSYEDKFTNHKGKEQWMRWLTRPWHEAQGLIVLTEDITERKRQEAELRHAKTKAEEASLAKKYFLANVSHEIRTPMNAILGMVRLLEKSGLTPRQSTYLEAIKASADNLLVIINDILDISKIESGKMTIETVGFDLLRLVRHLCTSIRHRAEEKGIGLFYEVDKRISPVLMGDPVRLNQVLLNLTNNAIKFTNKGSVEIECNLLAAFDNHQKIEFKVVDTGKGIAEDKLTKIFESFTQEDDSITREYGGTGLGLSISKQLVEIFGGDLRVQSRRSTGTTFSFVLDFAIGTESDLVRNPHQESHDQESLDGVKVLLVEDHDINQFLATTLLEEWGVKVTVAENGKEAIKRLSQEAFDIVLMDIQMPIMGGIEATKIIRSQLKSTIPIIALTANAIKGDRDKYLAVGMNDYISKPFEPTELRNSIATWINRDNLVIHSMAGVATLIDAVKPIIINPSMYDLDKLRGMFENDTVMYRRMLLMFLERTPASLTELNTAYKAQDWDALYKTSHKLKSSFGIMGMEILQKNCKLIEQMSKDQQSSEKIGELIEECNHLYDIIDKQLQAELQSLN